MFWKLLWPLGVPKQCSYILVGDNIDKTVTACHVTMDHQSQSLHYFHCYAALDRINLSHLNNSAPIGAVEDLPLSVFLPSTEDYDALQQNYTILLGREIVETVPYFEDFADCVPQQIPPRFRNEMQRKSSIVSLQTIQCILYYKLYIILICCILEDLNTSQKWVWIAIDKQKSSPRRLVVICWGLNAQELHKVCESVRVSSMGK